MAAPTLTSFSPATLPGNFGGQTTITGVAFTGTTAVTVNGVAATFTITDDTHLVVTIPNAVVGLATVIVTNGTGPTTNTTGLTITTYVPPVRNFVVALTGTFQTGPTLFTNNLADNYGQTEKSLWGGTYPTGYPQYQARVAKILAVNRYNARYPATAIAVPTL